MKNPPSGWTTGLSRKVLERREVEKRIYGGERKRLTASVTFHGYSLSFGFEHPMKGLKTKIDDFVNKKRRRKFAAVLYFSSVSVSRSATVMPSKKASIMASSLSHMGLVWQQVDR